MDKSRVEPTFFFIEKISFSLKLFSGHFYGQSFINTVRGPFLYRHFKQTDHSTGSISIQPVEKITYDNSSSKRYRNILRNELELKWIKLLQTPNPLGFNDNIYHEGNIFRLPDFDVFSPLDIRKCNMGSHGKCKNGN